MQSFHEAEVRIAFHFFDATPILSRFALHYGWSGTLEICFLLRQDSFHVEHSKHYPRHDISRGRNNMMGGDGKISP